MEYVWLGDAQAGPTIRLDHRVFSYAGKFVMSTTGKAIIEVDGDVVAAISFNDDRTDPSQAWLRYLTVHRSHRGEGYGPRLAGAVSQRLLADRYERVLIAVNNPFAYEALYRAGFGYTGRETGIAELVLARPSDRSTEQYQDGYAKFSSRESLAEEEMTFIERKRGTKPPDSEAQAVSWRVESPGSP